MRIEPLDLADDVAITEVVELWQAAFQVDFPNDPPFCPRWERGRIEHPSPGEPSEFWVAREGADLLGALDLGLPELDNVTTALADMVVLPSARRRGVGNALYAMARERMAELGRKLLVLMAPIDSPGAAFAESIHAQPGLVEVRRQLVVEPDSPAVWERLLATARSHAVGYSVVRWRDDVPEEHIDGVAYLTGRMSTDAPMENLGWEPEAYDAERVRRRQAAFAARGRRSYGCAVVSDVTGEVAGYTELAFDACNDAHAWQCDTIVDPAQRGHRLGMVLKIENLCSALAQEPALRTVSTFNARSNDHMIAINEAMGFWPLDTWCDWQLHLA